MKTLPKVNAFIDIIFPRGCIICNRILSYDEADLCLACIVNLPKHEDRKELLRRFWGHSKIDFAFSLLQYSKEGSVQVLLKEIKYNRNHELAYNLGKLISRSPDIQGLKLDSIIPVPLHIDKMKTRTFNQSECLSRAVSEELRIVNDTDSVIRKTNNSSQTKLERFDRWINVDSVFEVVKPQRITGKSVAIIDDVITTGATIGSLAKLIEKCEPKKLAVLSLAST